MTPDKPRRLGRGLEALIGSSQAPRASSPSSDAPAANELRRVPLAQIRANPFQPRRDFAEADLTELRASLAASGMLQPVVLRPAPGGNGFELISGERRFRAASQLGWPDIPALVRDADERTMLTLALIENLQRADLNVVEEARGYDRLHRDFQLTHQQIAEAVGKDRSTVSNLLRLLALPVPVLELLERGTLTMGHARALLAVADLEVAARLAADIAAAGLSVREAERRIRALTTAGKQSTGHGTGRAANGVAGAGASGHGTSTQQGPELKQVEDRLRKKLQTDVRVRAAAGSTKGTIEVSFYSVQDLDRLLDLLLGPPRVGD
ncbi:MAG TPA: ParB/RepB/Spo0J family partition protein [Gemmatimonadaceae bacterium]|nr:ParB/RepB/Spo0J family partition protein [Gemmatimonadaceae bacterium]